MKVPTLAVFLAAAGAIATGAQAPADPKLRAQLGQLFPSAKSFSPKEGDPPHFKAFADAQSLVGYAFWTTELEPLERGFDGPIKLLVGMDTKGVLTGVIVAQHNEPYGSWSIEPPAFAAQFRGKNIRDQFRVGSDIHAISRATITVSSAARAVRNSARRVARQLLSPPGPGHHE
jgi:NosR/NirI family transcriptional regulator, nitrous oxide reductase regulator